MTDLSDILKRVSENLAQVKPVGEFATDDDDPDVGLFEDAESLLNGHQVSQEDVLSAIELPAKYMTRAGMQRETLSQLLPSLPPVGHTVDLLSNANRAGKRIRGFSFSTFITHLIGLMNGAVTLHVSVWTLNHHSAAEIIQLINAGRITEFHLCVDQYFVKREFETARLLASALQYIPHSMTVFRNHAKVICLQDESDNKVVIRGSGNLSSQPRIEQYTVSTSPELHAFYVDNLFNWAIEEMRSQRVGLES